MPVMDQAVWASVSIATGEGEVTQFKRGDLLPDPADAEQAGQRTLLRLGGALRVVDVIYTPEELAEQAKTRGKTAAATDASLSAEDPADLAAAQPTLTSPHGTPVVIGAPEHADPGPVPPGNATRATWVDYAVARGMDRGEAEALTRDQLAGRFKDEPDF